MFCAYTVAVFCMFCVYIRPRYPVSIYKTIGPLVLRILSPLIMGNDLNSVSS